MSGVSRPSRRRLVGRLVAVVAIAALLGGALAAAAPAFESGVEGELDRGFGHDGSVTTPASFPVPWSQAKVQLAQAPDGGIVIGSETTLRRYLPDGSPDLSFGEAGRVTVTLPVPFEFSLSDLAVDPQGRVVAIGTAADSRSTSVPPASFAAVIRYLPQGAPDPSFGADGVVMTRLARRPASGAGARAMAASLGALDGEGRVTLVGGPVQRVPSCAGGTRLATRDRLLTRLLADGSVDPSFGDRGFADAGPIEAVASVVPAPGGGAVLAGSTRRRCGHGPELAVARLRPDGGLDRHFGEGGSRVLTGTVAAIALDGRGRIVVLCKERQQRARNAHDTKIARLLPDGRFDPEFSSWRVFEFEGPSYRWSALAIDSQERPLLVGTLVRPPSRRSRRYHRWFMVMRLRDSGASETHFGWQGWISFTRFDPHSDAAADEALIDPQGRLLVAGTAVRPGLAPAGGLALARFAIDG